MVKLIDEFRRGWQGTAQPSPHLSVGFAVFCLLVCTGVRFGLSLIRPDVFFVPYLPAVFFVAAFGGFRIGVWTAVIAGLLGVVVNFSDARPDAARYVLLAIFWIVCGLIVWVVHHYRTIVERERNVSNRLIREEEYRRLLVDELQHRLKNKLSAVHAVLHQVLQNQPEIWSGIDHRLRALMATDDLIARVDGSGCDIRDLLLSELGPYGHVRFSLNGSPLFLPAKLAVSLALVFHELATNAAKYGAFSSTQGLLQVSWIVSDGRLSITWDETEGPPVETVGPSGFGTKLLKSALSSFDGKTEIAYLRTGLHCTMQCRIPAS